MTRPADLARPALTPHVQPPGSPMARWDADLRIGLEYLPTGAYAWDDPDPGIVWDLDGLVWDAPEAGSGFLDVVCDFHALTIDPGEPDELGLFPAVQATLTLDNRSGRYTIWSADGRLVYWAPGRRLAIWANLDGTDWWLFNGRMTSWQADTVAGTVTVEAFDGFAAFAEELGADWTPGTAGQKALARIQAIAAATAYTDPISGDLGDVALTTEPVDTAPLEQAQRAALSDGGVFYGDADGQLVYRNRLWRAGRSDQATVPVFTDNVCDTTAIAVWDPVQAADDFGLFTAVELVNVAGTVVRAALGSGSPASWWTGRQWRLTHPDPDLWPDTTTGQALANYLLAQTSTPSMAVRAFSLYLLAPQLAGRWLAALSLRRGDRFEWVTDFTDAAGNPGRLDIWAIVVGVRHEITPESWLVTVTGTRTVDHVTPQNWDQSQFTWDDPDPRNVWRF